MTVNHDIRLIWDENGTPPELRELLHTLSEEYPIFNHGRGRKIVGYVLPFRQRGNSDLKDNYGARHVREKGHWKVLCHLMFGSPLQ